MTKPLVISGYALCWNEQACIHDDQGEFYEQFLPGSFIDSIKKRNQTVLYSHLSSLDFASAEAGQLTLFEDEKGLSFRIELENSHENRLLYNLIKDGQLSHVSVGFKNAEYKETKRGSKKFRLIQRADLVEISIVENPAYKTSSVRVGCNNRLLELISKIDKALF
ncbi:HK97 family phage prohead protease [Lysinibacillus sp. G01H]|uniref:HK97 family phage prohead protease n=1 Tax=Lysinibacillus sp. G01H TaxID=3026425 RepID=UPI00237DC24B|nr:HK97 family phage prohead protease [Lysinibacillus sp. G01H]WDU81336.1 HK97 family phage prohead protease [Lysinibacillus sp. G01H]